jgi:hypothetical protein
MTSSLREDLRNAHQAMDLPPVTSELAVSNQTETTSGQTAAGVSATLPPSRRATRVSPVPRSGGGMAERKGASGGGLGVVLRPCRPGGDASGLRAGHSFFF